jgi:shikimate kinase
MNSKSTTQKIILIGYMGSGKTTVGKELARLLPATLVDLDREIEKFENKTISEIFNKKGAIYFRKVERAVLEKVLKLKQCAVISLGGGTPCYFDTMDYLNSLENAATIYLDVSIPTLVSRLSHEKNKRPLLNNLSTSEDLTEFIGKHLFERRPYYRKAQHHLPVQTETAEAIAFKIKKLLY